MEKPRKTLLIILGCILSLLFVSYFIAKLIIPDRYAATKALVIEDIPASRVKDGMYTGTYQAHGIDIQVKVVVAAAQFSDIIFEKEVTDQYGKKAAQGIQLKVLAEQRTGVDTVSGATTSSKAILKAIETAVKKGLN